MTRDDIIKLAREAGLPIQIFQLERFAALVAAAERRKHQGDIERWKEAAVTAQKWRAMALSKDGDGRTVQRIQQEAAAAEREACAKLCDEMREHWSDYKDTALLNGDVELSNAASGEPRAAEFLAKAIRARSEA